MSGPIAFVFAGLAIMFALMVWERLYLDLVAMLAFCGLMVALGDFEPAIVLGAILLLTSVLTNLLSNKAVSLLLTPIAAEAAPSMHVSPRPFIMAAALGASACFATPIGYQTHTLVYGAGGYRFADFLGVGLPLTVLLPGSPVISFRGFGLFELPGPRESMARSCRRYLS